MRRLKPIIIIRSYTPLFVAVNYVSPQFAIQSTLGHTCNYPNHLKLHIFFFSNIRIVWEFQLMVLSKLLWVYQIFADNTFSQEVFISLFGLQGNDFYREIRPCLVLFHSSSFCFFIFWKGLGQLRTYVLHLHKFVPEKIT